MLDRTLQSGARPDERPAPARDTGEKRLVEIDSRRGGLSRSAARELWEFHHVFTGFVAREIKVRYKQTAIGIGWAFLQPVIAAGIFALFLGRVAHVQSEHAPYLIFALAGTVVWTYFSSALNLAAQSVVQNQMLVRKVYFPREILPFYSVVASIVDLAPGIVVLAIVAAFYGYRPHASWLLLPLPILIAIFAAAGLGIALAATNVYYRDIRYALPFLLQIGMFASPVVYSLSSVGEPARHVYGIANPMAASIDGVRRIVLHDSAPDMGLTLGALGWSLLLTLAGYIMFKRLERSFADRL